jgi:hypothetical protein
MKLPETDICTETSGVLKEHIFSVGNAGLILDILRTKIYKNPIQAIVREISSNARDAHREADPDPTNTTKADTPIKIFLPNNLSPYFKVQDFGPSISPDRMENVFVKFGNSTKREDNIQTGGFGLGCKTPFSYSDTFSVVTVTNGIKRVYTAYIDESKSGKCVLTSEEKADEENGTTIIIPVRKEDFDKFKEATLYITRFWQIKPDVVGINKDEYEKEEVIFSGDGWYIKKVDRRSYNYYNNHDPLAIVDGIQYPIDTNALNELDNDVNGVGNAGDKSIKQLLQFPIRIGFNIGDLALSASRDNIHYTPATQKIIIDRMREVVGDISKIAEDKISSAATYKDAVIEHGKIKDAFGGDGYRYGFLLDIKGVQWRGNILRSKITARTIGDWATITRFTTNMPYHYRNRNNAANRVHNFYTTRAYNSLAWPMTGPKTMLLHNDSIGGRISRNLIQHIFDENIGIEDIVVLSTPPKPSTKAFKEEKEIAEADGKTITVRYDDKLLKLLDLPKMSSVKIPKAKKKQLAQARKDAQSAKRKVDDTTVSGYILHTTGRYNSRLTFRSEVFELEESGIYLVVDYKDREFSTNSKYIDANDYKWMKRFLGEDIVGFAEKNIERLGDDWVSLYDALEEKVTEKLASISVDEAEEARLADVHLFKRHFSGFRESLIDKVRTSLNSKNSLILEYLEKSESVSTISGVEDSLKKAINYLNIKDKKKNKKNIKHSKIMKDLCAEVDKRYPLLKHIDYYYVRDRDSEASVICYINMMDEAYEKKIKNCDSASDDQLLIDVSNSINDHFVNSEIS